MGRRLVCIGKFTKSRLFVATFALNDEAWHLDIDDQLKRMELADQARKQQNESVDIISTSE